MSSVPLDTKRDMALLPSRKMQTCDTPAISSNYITCKIHFSSTVTHLLSSYAILYGKLSSFHTLPRGAPCYSFACWTKICFVIGTDCIYALIMSTMPKSETKCRYEPTARLAVRREQVEHSGTENFCPCFTQLSEPDVAAMYTIFKISLEVPVKQNGATVAAWNQYVSIDNLPITWIQ